MTPRGVANSLDGFETNRSNSESVQLTGIKPKALHFASPVKSPVEKVFSTASTKERTASGQHQDGSALGQHKAFGLSNCIYKCENAAENEKSPEVEQFQGDKENMDTLKTQKIEEFETRKPEEEKEPFGEVVTNTQYEIG